MRTLRSFLCCLTVLIASAALSATAATTLPTGGGQSFRNEQPSLALNYVVNIFGDPDDLGEVGMFAGSFAPQGWALAQGQLLPISQHTLLFGKLGASFGGDSRTTFALPDLRGRSPIGTGQGPGLPNYALGQQVGSEQVTLGDVAAHTHGIGTGYTTEVAGQALPHSNMQPSLALTPIIATEGIFPSRNLSAISDSDVAPIAAFGEPYLGEITWIAHNDVPSGWRVADGSLLPISNNQSLFSILGATYGGNGRSDFALPDLRGRVAVGEGNGPGIANHSLGQRYGTTEETLSVAQTPSHAHGLPDNLGQTASVGGGNPQSNLQPSLALTHIIALEGTYPSENLAAATGDEERLAAIGSGVEPYYASVSMFAGNFSPRNYASTDGQILSISQNAALFSLLGTKYGGDGRSTYGLPDLRGRTTVGVGQGAGLTDRDLGDRYGAESSFLGTNNLPSHTHEFTVLEGDYDLDGDVDGYDFLKWQRGESPNPLSPADLDAWQMNYGMVAPLSTSSTAVPEPTGLLLAILSTSGVCLLNRRSVKDLAKMSCRATTGPGGGGDYYSGARLTNP